MSKYIIDIPDGVEWGVVTCRTEDGFYTRDFDSLEVLNSDYINEHFGDLQDTAYQKGINDGSLDVKQRVEGAYQRGLEDAWEAARKILQMYDFTVFGLEHDGVFESPLNEGQQMTPQEAIEKLKAYEEKQKDKIEVGDEVIYNGTTKCIVVRPEDDERYASLIDSDGTHYSADHCECKKTGRHFDIASILEDIRND